MVHLAKEQFQPLLRPFTFGNIARNFRSANDFATFVFDWRHGQGNIYETTILCLPDRLVVIDAFAPPDSAKDEGFFVMPIHWDEKGDRLPHRFFRGVAEEKLGAAVPARDDPIQVF